MSAIPKIKPWRSEKHRRLVANLPCVVCGKWAPNQCAHANFSKSLALKVSDALTFPLCPDCHRNHDSGGMPRAERWKREWEYCDHTRAELIARSLWTPETEHEYQIAIEPLARVVHGEDA